ncbi:hypothetical protein RU07_01995 [Agrobacterium tumefaciens]|uniref:Uncharacterized protein n=1 Tax=Agrobacterium tumefaciens TaxID=358 RepID=A0A0D0K8I7_AGRTU|nr:hypothetical protein RU07_01995 [Agrobacterium tumefaciens]
MQKLLEMGENASVQIAAGPAYLHTGKRLEPRLWEALRVEMQYRLRRATGEPHAVVSFEFGTEAT